MSDRKRGRFENVRENGLGVDISQSGIGLDTDYPLARGDVLKLYFTAAVGNTILPVYVEVMWAMPVGGKFRAGLRFLV